MSRSNINVIHPKTLSRLPIRISGRLIGVHAVLRGDQGRSIAVLFAEGFQNYVLFLTQVEEETMELEVELEETLKEQASAQS